MNHCTGTNTAARPSYRLPGASSTAGRGQVLRDRCGRADRPGHVYRQPGVRSAGGQVTHCSGVDVAAPTGLVMSAHPSARRPGTRLGSAGAAGPHFLSLPASRRQVGEWEEVVPR